MRFVVTGLNDPELFPQDAGGSEDVEMGECMGVEAGYLGQEEILIPGIIPNDSWYKLYQFLLAAVTSPSPSIASPPS